MTPSGRPIYFSRHMREFLGFDVAAKDEPDVPRLQSLLGAIIHPDDLDRVNERLDHSLRTGAPYALTHRQRRFDGTFRWVEKRLAAMRDAACEIVQWQGACLALDDPTRAQDELRPQQDKHGETGRERRTTQHAPG